MVLKNGHTVIVRLDLTDDQGAAPPALILRVITEIELRAVTLTTAQRRSIVQTLRAILP
jgi:hypothetical protein